MATVTQIHPPSTLPAVTPSRTVDKIARALAEAIAELSPAPSTAPDALMPIVVIAKEWKLEHRGFRAFVDRAGVRTVRIGRQVCVRRSDVLALVDTLPEKPAKVEASTPADGYAALVSRARGAR